MSPRRQSPSPGGFSRAERRPQRGWKGENRERNPGPRPGSGDVLKPRVSSVAEVVAASAGSDHSLAMSSCRPWTKPA